MNNRPIIKTERLQIVPFSEVYLTSRYVSWLNDPEVVRYSEQRHRFHTLDSCRAYWLSFFDTPNLFYAIIVSDVMQHIGNINAYVDEQNQTADIGILIGEKAVWRQGYGLEAWEAVCKFLLKSPGIRKVTAGTLSVNMGMLSVMERAGMVDDGRRIRQNLWDKHEVDIVHKALFRENDRKGFNMVE